jgi:LacI family transcriptional regulator
MYTVARHAGVSIATVSRVLGGRGGPVRDRTAQRVFASARAVGYRLNGAARAPAARHHGAIGVVFPNLSGPYYGGVILGLEEAAQTLGQSVLMAATHGRPDSDDLVSGVATKVDGLVLFGRTASDELVQELAGAMPVVLLARPQVASASTVRAENHASARALACHLVGHGHRRIAFVGDPTSSPDAAERWAGYRDGLSDAAIRPPQAPDTCAFREADGYRVAALVLRRSRPPTALFCANDEIAMGACSAAADLGMTVPGDVAITGWDDIPVARYLSPPLTTVRQPLVELGARAAALLQVGIDGVIEPAEPVTLATELVIRGSCGCPTGQRPTA